MEKYYLISIASYKRPNDLSRLLESIRKSTVRELANVDVLVVDNDPSKSAYDAVHSAGYSVQYVSEPQPGIAAARNAGLERFNDKYSAIIFVDDDEWLSDDWFSVLTSFWKSSSADVVQGAVMSNMPPDTPEWIRRGGFYQRALPASGTRLLSAATNNTLLSRDIWIRAGKPMFDGSYSETGGSDWEFFWGLRRAGASIVMCAEAVAHEDIPVSRLSYRWLARRAFRSGMVHTRVRLKHKDRAVLTACRGVLRLAMYLCLLLTHAVKGRIVNAKAFNEVHFELGRVSALLGVRVYEYRRSKGGRVQRLFEGRV